MHFLWYTGFKSVPFLNFFFARIKRNPALTPPGKPIPLCNSPHWTEDASTLKNILDQEQGWDMLWTKLQSEGMSWFSKCQGEWNVIHAVDTPIVFHHLSSDGSFLKPLSGLWRTNHIFSSTYSPIT